MTHLTLQRLNSWGDMETKTFVIINSGKYGFDVKLPKGKKVYTAVRNLYESDLINVLDGRGGIMFTGVKV